MSRKEVGRGYASIKDCVDMGTEQQYQKVQRKTNYSYQEQRWQHENKHKKQRLEKRNRKKSNCIDILIDKTGEILHKKTWTWLRKGSLKRESLSLLKTAYNHAIKISYIKAKIDNALQNSKCSFSRERDETVNYISE